MRLNHAQRRALRLLDRGVDVAYWGLTEAARDRLARAGLADPAEPGILTTLGKAALLSTKGDASVMVERSGGRSPTTGIDR
jgi:hypothetical protein